MCQNCHQPFAKFEFEGEHSCSPSSKTFTGKYQVTVTPTFEPCPVVEALFTNLKPQFKLNWFQVGVALNIEFSLLIEIATNPNFQNCDDKFRAMLTLWSDNNDFRSVEGVTSAFSKIIGLQFIDIGNVDRPNLKNLSIDFRESSLVESSQTKTTPSQFSEVLSFVAETLYIVRNNYKDIGRGLNVKFDTAEEISQQQSLNPACKLITVIHCWLKNRIHLKLKRYVNNFVMYCHPQLLVTVQLQGTYLMHRNRHKKTKCHQARFVIPNLA